MARESECDCAAVAGRHTLDCAMVRPDGWYPPDYTPLHWGTRREASGIGPSSRPEPSCTRDVPLSLLPDAASRLAVLGIAEGWQVEAVHGTGWPKGARALRESYSVRFRKGSRRIACVWERKADSDDRWAHSGSYAGPTSEVGVREIPALLKRKDDGR